MSAAKLGLAEDSEESFFLSLRCKSIGSRKLCVVVEEEPAVRVEASQMLGTRSVLAGASSRSTWSGSSIQRMVSSAW